MKYLKILIAIFAVTCITSTMSVFAGDGHYSFNVPGFNGHVQTDLRPSTDKLLMKEEVLSNVVVSPANDTLDVILKNEYNLPVGPWREIQNGKKTVFNGRDEILPAPYYLYIDSRWNYTKTTYTSFDWSY